jgi:hypothetical protein
MTQDSDAPLSPSSAHTDRRVLAMFEETIYGHVRSLISDGASSNKSIITFQFAMDAGTVAIPTGLKVPHMIDFPARVKSWTLLADAPSDVTLDVLWGTYEEYPTMMSMCGTTYRPTLVSPQIKNQSTINLATAWTFVDLRVASLLRFNLLTYTAKQLAIIFRLERAV